MQVRSVNIFKFNFAAYKGVRFVAAGKLGVEVGGWMQAVLCYWECVEEVRFGICLQAALLLSILVWVIVIIMRCSWVVLTLSIDALYNRRELQLFWNKWTNTWAAVFFFAAWRDFSCDLHVVLFLPYAAATIVYDVSHTIL